MLIPDRRWSLQSLVCFVYIKAATRAHKAHRQPVQLDQVCIVRNENPRRKLKTFATGHEKHRTRKLLS